MQDAHPHSARDFTLRPQIEGICLAFLQRERLLIELDVPESVACLLDFNRDDFLPYDGFRLFAFRLEACVGTFVRPRVPLVQIQIEIAVFEDVVGRGRCVYKRLRHTKHYQHQEAQISPLLPMRVLHASRVHFHLPGRAHRIRRIRRRHPLRDALSICQSSSQSRLIQ